MVNQIIAVLHKLDEKIERTRDERDNLRKSSGTAGDREVFLDGIADGLAKAYSDIKSLVEGTPELAQWEREYFQVEVDA